MFSPDDRCAIPTTAVDCRLSRIVESDVQTTNIGRMARQYKPRLIRFIGRWSSRPDLNQSVLTGGEDGF